MRKRFNNSVGSNDGAHIFPAEKRTKDCLDKLKSEGPL